MFELNLHGQSQVACYIGKARIRGQEKIGIMLFIAYTQKYLNFIIVGSLIRNKGLTKEVVSPSLSLLCLFLFSTALSNYFFDFRAQYEHGII